MYRFVNFFSFSVTSLNFISFREIFQKKIFFDHLRALFSYRIQTHITIVVAYQVNIIDVRIFSEQEIYSRKTEPISSNQKKNKQLFQVCSVCV